MQQEPVVLKIKNFLDKYKLHGKKFVIGFSGGFDSMCTLDILSRTDVQLIAAHYNHGWRIEADTEEQHCKEFCEIRGIEFYSGHAPEDLKHTETAAREARYNFLEQVRQLYNADGIITAHNSDDNAETVLYRIIKGTGISGLKGIQPVRDNIYRPILDCTRSEIETYCKTHNLSPNIDSSNSDIKYNRNLIRHKILPAMESINQEVKNSINKLSELAKLDEKIINEYIEQITRNVLDNNRIIIPEFIKLSAALQQKIIYNLVSKYLDEYDLKKIKECLAFISDNCQNNETKKKSLTTDIWLAVNKHECIIYKEEPVYSNEILINGCGEFKLGENVLVIEECIKAPGKFPEDKTGIAYVDLSKIVYPLTLRQGRNNDTIKPLGMNGSMLLKKYLSGRRITQYKRKNLTVLACGNEVLWVPFVGLSSNIAVNSIPTHKLYFLAE